MRSYHILLVYLYRIYFQSLPMAPIRWIGRFNEIQLHLTVHALYMFLYKKCCITIFLKLVISKCMFIMSCCKTVSIEILLVLIYSPHEIIRNPRYKELV